MSQKYWLKFKPVIWKTTDTATLVTTVILITSSQETGTFHFCSSIGKPSDVIDSIGRYTLIILIICPASGNIPSTNSEMKSAANSSEPILSKPSPVCLMRNKKQQTWQQEPSKRRFL